jgi:hypothetical protein
LKNLELLMKTRLFRFAAFFCSVFLMLSCFLISPSPAWAYQAADSDGGSSNSDSGSSGSKDGGSFNEHLNSAAMNGINGGLSGAVAGGVIGGSAAVAPGFVAGSVGKVLDGCLSGCHESPPKYKGNSKQNPDN